MRHTGTVLLTTERLLLRPFTPEDAPAAFHGWLSSPEATKYLSFRPHRDLGVTETVVGYRRICGRHDTRNPASGAVLKKIGMEFEGVARLAARDNDGNFCDVANYSKVVYG